MTARPTTDSLSASTAALLLTAVGSGVILGVRSRRSSPVALLAGLAIAGLAVRKPIARALKQAGTRRRTADVRFSFTVNRPVELVFAFCADFENFPRFIRSLHEVRDNGDGRSHWRASTPGGGEVEWDAVTTKFVTNSVIGWRSVPGSPVETTGLLRFSNEDGRTCVHVAMSYGVLDSSLRGALAALTERTGTHQLKRDISVIEAHIQHGDLEDASVARVE